MFCAFERRAKHEDSYFKKKPTQILMRYDIFFESPTKTALLHGHIICIEQEAGRKTPRKR